MPPEYCPNCGTEVPPNARACPECGSCEETGWSEDNQFGGADIPDDTFDYEDFVGREFGSRKHQVRGLSPFWRGVALILVLVMLGFLLRAIL
jgi:uncharacterized membrane protein YvbJ